MKRPIQPFVALVMGLAAAQAIGTFHVYFSNRDLYRTIGMLHSAGYLTVPNRIVAETLTSPVPALAGGLFFTLTVGAFLSLGTIGIIRLLHVLGRGRKMPVVLSVALWVLILISMNAGGVNLYVTAYFVLVPCVILYCLKGLNSSSSRLQSRRIFLSHLVAVLCLAALWAGRMDKDIFLQIRDRILLPTPAGRVVNDFYYSHTLYPAYAFKTMEQRLIKACHVEDIPAGVDPAMLRTQLILRDYLPVGDRMPELIISGSEDLLAFMWNGEELLRESPARFFASPGETLKQVSEIADNNSFFRQFAFVSLLLGFPLLIYVTLAGFVAYTTKSLGIYFRILPAAVCFIAGLSLLIVFIHREGVCEGPEDLQRAAASHRWQDRVAAIKTALRHDIDIGKLSSFELMKSSPLVVERYWVAKALGRSRLPWTYGDLVSMLDDPHPNVVYTAFESLGRRNRPEAIAEILGRLPTSTHWYCQWYAYRALRSLGWSQERLVSATS